MVFRMPPKPHPLPPDDFNQLSLPVSIAKTRDYYRLNSSSFSTAIYFDKSGAGRFDEPQQSYGICYTGETLEAAFIESFGRELGVKFVSQELLRSRNLFLISNSKDLKLVNLFGSSLAKLGADSRLTGGDDYGMSRAWAEAIYHHPQQVDGIRYFSRHDNEQLCCGLFDRSQKVLSEVNQGNLLDKYSQKLGDILDRYQFSLG